MKNLDKKFKHYRHWEYFDDTFRANRLDVDLISCSLLRAEILTYYVTIFLGHCERENFSTLLNNSWRSGNSYVEDFNGFQPGAWSMSRRTQRKHRRTQTMEESKQLPLQLARGPQGCSRHHRNSTSAGTNDGQQVGQRQQKWGGKGLKGQQ